MEHSYSSDKFTSSLYFDTWATQLRMRMPSLYFINYVQLWSKANKLHNMGAWEAKRRMSTLQSSSSILVFFWLQQKLKEQRVCKADSAYRSQKQWIFGRMLGSGDSTDRKLWQLTEMVTERNGPGARWQPASIQWGALHHTLVIVLALIISALETRSKDALSKSYIYTYLFFISGLLNLRSSGLKLNYLLLQKS